MPRTEEAGVLDDDADVAAGDEQDDGLPLVGAADSHVAQAAEVAQVTVPLVSRVSLHTRKSVVGVRCAG